MSGQRGMTLIEILVAMSVLAVLSVLGYRAFANLLLAREQLMQTGERWIQLARVLRRLEAELQRLPRAQPGMDAQSAAASTAGLQLQPVAGGQQLLLRLFSARYPDGEERVQYQATAGLDWRAGPSDSQLAATPFTLLAPGYRVQWRVLAAGGRWYPQWPPQQDARARPLALEMQVAIPGDATVRRLWVLP